MCVYPRRYNIRQNNGITQEYEVPCGCCYECLKKKRAEYAFRNTVELNSHKFGYFTTLTYADEFYNQLPLAYPSTLRLNPITDLQKWLKRMRKKHTFRYFAVSEYGEEKRLHYHILIYSNERIPRSSIDTTWTQGFNTHDTITPARIHYVTKYTLKVFNSHYTREEMEYIIDANRDRIEEPEYYRENKDAYKIEYIDQLDLEKFEQTVMFYNNKITLSTKPYLGYQYLTPQVIEQYRRYMKHGEKYPPVILNGFKYALPRIYLKKIFTDEERVEYYDLYRQQDYSNQYNEVAAKKMQVPLKEYMLRRRAQDLLNKKAALGKKKLQNIL